jgi:hypothetical protein
MVTAVTTENSATQALLNSPTALPGKATQVPLMMRKIGFLNC